MITRHEVGERVTYYGDAPLVDHDGYTVEVVAEEGDQLMHLRIATSPTGGPKLRADLPAALVHALIARCQAWLNDHQEKS